MKLPHARTEKLTIRELPEETLVYDLLRNKSHCLNRTAALVWQHCDGQTTVAEMADILRQELDLPADAHIVRLALEQLSRRHLLKEEITPLSTKARITRRDALKKIAVVAAALPIVMTLTAKAASVNASSQAQNIACEHESDCGPGGACQVFHCIKGSCQGQLLANGTVCNNGNPSSTCQNGLCVSCLPAGASLSGCSGGKNSQCCSGNCVSTGTTDTCS